MSNTVNDILSGVEVTTVLAIRRRPGLVGLPGDNPVNYNYKVGSSLKGVDTLRGLTRKEEQKYLPQLINVYPEDTQHWLQATRDYWSNISVFVPSDEELEGVSKNELKGKVLKFTVSFANKDDANAFSVANLEDKARITQEAKCEVVEGIADYVLFRYCLVYGRVANSFETVNNSPKIRFYLYSKDQEIKKEYDIFKERTKATEAFLTILNDEKIIDSILRMFDKNPDSFESLSTKHLELENIKNTQPREFMDYIKDKDLVLKANIKKAVRLGIIYNPQNTDSYYYGAENEILLGKSLLDAVLYFRSEDSKNKEIVESIARQLKIK